jgi:hypothetical protein
MIYDNTVDFGVQMISQSLLMPSIIINTSSKILFYDANNQMINKIKVTATRDSEPFLKGTFIL